MAKSTNEELNLTPFIGLFAMLVVLLLVTAVWNTTEVLSTNTQAPSSAAVSSPPQPEDKKPNIDLKFTVLVDRVQIAVGTEKYDFPLIEQAIDAPRLLSYLEKLKQTYPDKEDAILYTDNRTPYKHLIDSFDLLIEAGFPDVGVSTE